MGERSKVSNLNDYFLFKNLSNSKKYIKTIIGKEEPLAIDNISFELPGNTNTHILWIKKGSMKPVSFHHDAFFQKVLELLLRFNILHRFCSNASSSFRALIPFRIINDAEIAFFDFSSEMNSISFNIARRHSCSQSWVANFHLAVSSVKHSLRHFIGWGRARLVSVRIIWMVLRARTSFGWFRSD